MLGCRSPKVITETRDSHPGAAIPPRDPPAQPHSTCVDGCTSEMLCAARQGAYNEPLSQRWLFAWGRPREPGLDRSKKAASWPGAPLSFPGVTVSGHARGGGGYRGQQEGGHRWAPGTLTALSRGVGWGGWIKPAGRATARPTNGPKNLSRGEKLLRGQKALVQEIESLSCPPPLRMASLQLSKQTP